MNFLLALILANPVSVTVPDGTWISPDCSVIEEWSISPLEYISITGRLPIGSITEIEEDSDHIWKIVLIESDRILLFEDNVFLDQLDIPFDISDFTIMASSPHNEYLLLVNGEVDGSAMRVDLHHLTTDRFEPYFGIDPSSAMMLVTDNGTSLFKLGRTGHTRRMFNAEFELIYEDIGGRGYNEFIASDDTGNRSFLTKSSEIICINDLGREEWITRIEGYSNDNSVHALNCDAEGNVLAIQRRGLIQVFSGDTGDEIYREQANGVIADPVFSNSGQYMAVATRYTDECENRMNGFAIYRIDSTQALVSKSVQVNFENDNYFSMTPIVVTDSGSSLVKLLCNNLNDHRFAIFNSSGTLQWVSDCMSDRSEDNSLVSFIPPNSSRAGLSSDGQNFWYYDGNNIHSLRLVSE
jgi:hypothetical protein